MFEQLNPYLGMIKIGAWVVLGLVLVGLWVRGNHYQDKYSVEHGNYVNFVAGVDREAKAREAEIKAKDLKAKADAKAAKDAWLAEKSKLQLDTAKLKKDLEHDKAYISNVIAMYSGLRDSRSASGSAGGQVPGTTVVPTQSGGDCNATLVGVVNACKDTTVNYNALWNAWNDNCATYGCKPN